MKRKIISLIGLVSVTTTLFASNNAESIFDSKCAMCHIKTMPQDKSSLVAPPLMGVMRHVKMSYPDKKAAVDFIVDYVQAPSKAKAVCMPQKIARFGVMPSQKGNITPKELRKVASWMYDNYPSSNFRGGGMMQKSMNSNSTNNKMRGMRKRPTFEMFDANGDGVISKKEFTTFQNNHMKMMKKNGMSCQGKSKKSRRKHVTFATFDLNKDGFITKDELLKVRADRKAKRAAQGKPMKSKYKAPSFESMDANGDGKISPQEFKDFRKQRMMKKMSSKGMNSKNGSCQGMMQK